MLQKLTTRQFLKRASIVTGAAIVAPNFLVSRSYAGVCSIIDISGDKRVKLSYSSFARAFTVGAWTRIRVGVRYRLIGTTNETSNPQFFVGFCSGSTNQIFDATTTNSIGAGSTSPATWSYVDDVVDRYNATNGFIGGKRVGSTWTNVAGVVTMYHPANGDLMAMIADITTGSPNFTVGVLYPSSTSYTGISRDTFLTQMAAAGNPAATGHSYGTNTLAFSEGDGTLDHVCVGWNKINTYIEVTDLAVARIS